MNNFNYALDGKDYTLQNALFLGNSKPPQPSPPPKDLTDHTKTLPTDLASLICSKLKDQRDIIALAQTNTLWRCGVTRHCSRLIPNMFGNVFNLEKRSPVKVFVDLWGPIKLKSNRLATVVPRIVSRPSSLEMTSVIRAIKEGTVEELSQKIAALKDPTELTMLKFGIKDYLSCPANPLKLAVESCDIVKVRLLIDSGTPVGIGESGMIGEFFNAPLVEAGTRKQEAILRLLLENGASFGVKENLRIGQPYQRADYIPQPILYPMLENIDLDENDEVGLRCVALVLRSWRDEQGLEAIQNDPSLAKFASKCILSCSRYQIGKLLKSYGVVPGTIDTELLHSHIAIGVLNAKMGYIEYLSNMGFLNFQDYRNNDGFSLADIAVRYGQFELESYFVEKKRVPYCDRKKALEVLEKEVCQQLGELGPKCIHLKKIIQHYQLNIDGTHIDGNTALLTLCYMLHEQAYRFAMDFKEMLNILMYIETYIIPLGANLDFKNKLEKDTPRFILEATKGVVSRYANTSKIIEKIESILG